jgi:ankyrin repeat protein
MKILLTTIAALLLVGCGESQQSTALTESKPAEPVAEASQPEPTTAKAPDISIHEAAALGDIEAVKQFLDSGTDVNAKDKTGGTPLDEASGWGRKDIVELLIAKGADVNAKFEDDGSTPLHLAAWKGHFETAELLIAADAYLNAKMEDGDTPLDLAERESRRDSSQVKAAKKEIADLLRKHGGKTGAELKAEGK